MNRFELEFSMSYVKIVLTYERMNSEKYYFSH